MQAKPMRCSLALLLVVLMALFVGASAASGAVWKKEGKNITKSTEINLTEGEMLFTIGLKELYCSLKGKIYTEGGSTGQMFEFAVYPCEGGGSWANCEVSVASVGLAWPVNVLSASYLLVEKVRFKFTVSGPCGLKETLEGKADSTWTPDNPTAFGLLGFQGISEGFEYSGVVHVNPAGVYGLG